MSESLRPPLFTRRRVLGTGAFAAARVGIAVGEAIPGAGAAADFARPESDAIWSAYHTAVDAALARIAPGATLAP